tara:strand:+ start:81 stop:740 length:660 start_codon:yes stop_codon:yes gene_type:complete
MNHSFDVNTAVRHGIQAAILIENLRFWLIKNIANKKNLYEGHYWTYNSAKAFAELFPYMSEDSIQRVLKKLEVEGILFTGNFNNNSHDRTKWYRLSEEFLSAESPIAFRKNAESTNTDINKDKNTVTKEKKDSSELFDVFWNAYPRKINKGGTRSVFAKIKPSEETLQKMISAIDKQKRSDQWKEVKYIPHPSSWLNGERWEDEDSTGKPSFNPLAGAF